MKQKESVEAQISALEAHLKVIERKIAYYNSAIAENL